MTKVQAIVLFMALLLSSCSKEYDDARVLAVTVPAQEWLLRQLVGPEWEVVTLLSAGADPESYDPTAADISRLADARAWMMLGTMPFEQRFAKMSQKPVDLSQSVELFAGTHGSGVDPHIWLSTTNMRAMARQMADTLMSIDPEHKVVYAIRLQTLDSVINAVDMQARERVTPGTPFLMWHPSLGYFARDYDLKLTSLAAEEHKETTVKGVAERRVAADESGARVAVLQAGSEDAKAAFVPKGVKIVYVNLLTGDWPSLIDSISTALQQ